MLQLCVDGRYALSALHEHIEPLEEIQSSRRMHFSEHSGSDPVDGPSEPVDHVDGHDHRASAPTRRDHFGEAHREGMRIRLRPERTPLISTAE